MLNSLLAMYYCCQNFVNLVFKSFWVKYNNWKIWKIFFTFGFLLLPGIPIRLNNWYNLYLYASLAVIPLNNHASSVSTNSYCNVKKFDTHLLVNKKLSKRIYKKRTFWFTLVAKRSYWFSTNRICVCDSNV